MANLHKSLRFEVICEACTVYGNVRDRTEGLKSNCIRTNCFVLGLFCFFFWFILREKRWKQRCPELRTDCKGKGSMLVYRVRQLFFIIIKRSMILWFLQDFTNGSFYCIIRTFVNTTNKKYIKMLPTHFLYILFLLQTSINSKALD